MLITGSRIEYRVSGFNPQLLPVDSEWVENVWLTLGSPCASVFSIQPEGLPHLILSSKKGPGCTSPL